MGIFKESTAFSRFRLTMRIPLCPLILCLLLALGLAQDFDIPFGEAVSVADVKAAIAEAGKPGVVFVTQPWCGACKGLKRSVNANGEIKALLGDFVVAHASGDDGTQWQAPGRSDGYIPRVYFLNVDGSYAAVTAPNPSYEYFFPSAAAVKKGLEQVLQAN
jgi:hypothetical protein